MSSQKTKVVLGLGGLLAALALLRRRPVEPIEYSANVEVDFTQTDEGAGRRIGRIAFAPTIEGQAVPNGVRVKVTNTSTQAGAPINATLTTVIDVKTSDGTVVLATTGGSINIPANQSYTYSYALTAPLGKAGQIMTAIASVKSPAGVTLITASKDAAILALVLSAPISGALIFVGLNPSVYLTNGMAVAWNQDVIIGFDYTNQSNIPITGHAGLTVTSPDGVITTPNATAHQDEPVAIGYLDTGVRFASFKTSQTGTYTLQLWMVAKGYESKGVIGLTTYTIIVGVPEIVYGATVVISG